MGRGRWRGLVGCCGRGSRAGLRWVAEVGRGAGGGAKGAGGGAKWARVAGRWGRGRMETEGGADGGKAQGVSDLQRSGEAGLKMADVRAPGGVLLCEAAAFRGAGFVGAAGCRFALCGAEVSLSGPPVCRRSGAETAAADSNWAGGALLEGDLSWAGQGRIRHSLGGRANRFRENGRRRGACLCAVLCDSGD